MKFKLTKTALLSLLFSITSAMIADAATLFWSGNGTVQGGIGTWDTTTAHFGTSTSGPFTTIWNNANSDNATIDNGTGVGGSITIGAGGIVMNGTLTFNASLTGTYSVDGAPTLTFGPGSSVVVGSTLTRSLNAPYAGTLTMSGPGTLALNASTSTATNYIVNGGTVSAAAGNRYGTAADTANFFTLNGGTLSFNTTEQFIISKSIRLGAGGGTLTSASSAITPTLDKPVSGTAGGSLTLGGSSAAYILANSGNSWDGGLIISRPVWLGAANVIPDSATVTINTGGNLSLTNGLVIAITKTASGTAYTSAPTIAITGGGGSGATATCALTGTTVNRITLTAPGSGYTSAPTVTFSGGGGSGATATASVSPIAINETVGNVVLAGGTISGSGGVLTATNYDFQSGTASAVLAGTAVNITKSTAGTVTLSGTNTYTGKTIVSGGLLTLNNPSGSDSVLGTAPASPVADQLTISNAAAISLGSAANVTLATNRGITLGAGGGILQGASKDLTIPGNITGPGGFTKTGSANLTLFGVNDFSGGFTITGGGVRLNGDDVAGHGGIVVGPTTSIVTLRNISPTVSSSVTNAITVNGGGTSDIDLTCASGNTFTLSGNISGAGYMTRGRASGASGNVVLSGNNSGWSGGLNWGRGLLTLGHKNALGSGTLTSTNLVAGESNVLMSATSLVGVNAVTNPVSLTGLMLIAGGNDLELSGPVTLAAGVNTITNRDAAAFAISGIIGGAGALTIAGPSTTVFAGATANNYVGATIVNGSLDVQKDGGLSTGNVTVNNGAVLKLENGINNTYIASSANLLLSGATPVVNLAFTGTPNTINALSFDGGTTFKAAGTWGAIGSGAQHTDARFTGTGMLNVTTGPVSSTALASSGSPAAYGSVTLTATITTAGAATGTVNFYDGATLIGSSPVASGVAILNASSLNVAGSPHSLTAVYSGDNNFGGSTSSAISQDITPKTVTAVVTVNNRPYDGTTSATIATRSLTGVVGADDVNLGATGSASFADKDAANGKSVTVTGLAISGTTAVNYTLASDTVVTSANITKIALTVTGLSASDKAYDGNTSASLNGTAALSAGVVGSEDVTLAGTAVGAFANKNVANGKNVNVTGLSLSGADTANYTLTPLVLTANITAGPALTVTGITAENKAYDGTNTATLVVSNAVLVGVVSGDDVTLVTTNATGVFSDELVGDGKTVTISGLTLAGVDATNYSLTQPTATADIKNALGVSGITASDKAYDATTAASIDTSGAALVGVIGADDVTLVVTNAAGAFGDKNVGIGKTVTISGLTLAGVDASKYLPTNVTATASISTANLAVTGLSATSKTYDGTTTAAITGTAALAGVLLSDVVTPSGTAAGTFATKNVGTGISVSVAGITLAGADAGNYSVTQPTLSADINAVSLTITGLSAVSKTYDAGTNAAITGTAGLSGVIGLEDVSVTGTAAGSFADKTVGLAKPVAVIGLSLSGADAGNYTLASLTLSANINQLVLTQTGITALNKVYDATTTVTFGGTMTVPGILGGDVVTLSGTPVGSFGTKDVGIAKSVGFGGVFLTGADAGNYDLQLQLLSADITAAPLTVTGLAASDKAYDGTNTATVTGTPALSGVISNDVVTLTGTASGTFSDKNVGIAKAVTVSGLGLSGADAGNYSLTQPTLSASITASGLTVTGLSGVNKVYDTFTTASVTGTAALAGVVAGDVVSVTGTPSGSFADKLAGIGKAVTVTGLSLTGADAGNYTLTQPTLSADITPAPLTVSGITADNKVYDATTAATFSGTGVLSGILTGDTVTLGGTPGGSFGTKDAGIGKSVSFVGVFPTGPDAANYDLQLQLLSADITPAALTVTGLSAVSKVYDATLVASVTGTPALAGVILGDDVTLTGVASGSFTTKTVGVAKTVTVSGLGKTGVDAGNYTLTLPNLSADITSATLTITGLSASNKVYDGTTSATVTGTAALADIQGSDVVSTTGTAAGTFADKNVGTGKNVAVTGLTLTGGDAGNYTLAALTLTADITSLASSNALVSSINPSEPGSNVTFTATLAGTPPAADAPTGDVVFLSNGVAFSTNSLVSGVATASTVSLATGTNTISAEYAGDVNFTGSTNSLEQVVASLVTCSAVNTLVGIGNNNDGTFTLTFQGTPQAEYYIVTSTDVTTPIASWTVLAGSTNAVTNLSGAWSFTVTNATPQQFYRSAAVVPCQ